MNEYQRLDSGDGDTEQGLIKIEGRSSDNPCM